MADLQTDVRYIKGVGETRAAALARLGIHTLRDLITFFPRGYEDRTLMRPIRELVPGENACVRAMLAADPTGHRISGGRTIVKARAVDDSGSLELTLRLLSILRLLFPYALLPSTTALGTIHPQGRELGLKAGGNVVMPNLSPVRVRKLYELYENKICTGEEAAQCRGCLEQRVKSAGYEIVTARGDVKR